MMKFEYVAWIWCQLTRSSERITAVSGASSYWLFRIFNINVHQ